jgi:hypothetical protein
MATERRAWAGQYDNIRNEFSKSRAKWKPSQAATNFLSGLLLEMTNPGFQRFGLGSAKSNKMNFKSSQIPLCPMGLDFEFFSPFPYKGPPGTPGTSRYTWISVCQFTPYSEWVVTRKDN